MEKEIRYEQKNVFTKEGVAVGTVTVPEDYAVEGSTNASWQSKFDPFIASMRASDPSGEIVMVVSFEAEVADKTIEPAIKKFEREQDGRKVVVFEVADYKCVESSCPEHAPLDGMQGIAERTAAGIKDALSAMGSGLADGRSGGRRTRRDGNPLGTGFHNLGSSGLASLDMKSIREAAKDMSFSDWMHGGLAGKMKRDKEAAEARTQAEESGKHADILQCGVYRKCVCVAPAEREAEASSSFDSFVESALLDQALFDQTRSLIAGKPECEQR